MIDCVVVIDRLRSAGEKEPQYTEGPDWQPLDHTHKDLWQRGLEQLHQTQTELVAIMDQQKDELLDIRVAGKTYTYRELLNGIIQHDIYHLGQVAYIVKLLK